MSKGTFSFQLENNNVLDTESECGLLIVAELELNMTTTPKNSAQVTEMSHTLRNGQPQPSARQAAQSSNTTGVLVSFVCFLELYRLYRCTVYCKIKKSWTGKNVKRLHHEFPTVCQGLLYTWARVCLLARVFQLSLPAVREDEA